MYKYPEEDKQKICDLLIPVLRETRDLNDVVRLEYIRISDSDEIVEATFDNGYTKKANVSMDSGCALIRDIIQQIQ